jgi:hypothetical protein
MTEDAGLPVHVRLISPSYAMNMNFEKILH